MPPQGHPVFCASDNNFIAAVCLLPRISILERNQRLS
jgi:hypothetical protein